MYKLLSVLLAVSSTDVLDTGKTIGTSSNQVILGMLVVALILVVLYREKQQVRANREAEKRHYEAMAKSDSHFRELLIQQETDRKAWDIERLARINMLMTLVGESTKALNNTSTTVMQNSTVITELSRIVEGFKEILYKIEHVFSQKYNK